MNPRWLLVFAFCCMAGAQNLVTGPVSNAAASTGQGFKSRDERYRLQASDVIDVTFRFTPEFNQTVNVQPDGFISLNVAGEFKVAGLTVAETTSAIRAKCESFLHDPVVTVSLLEFSKPFFVVSGQVQKPGRFELRGFTTVSDAVAIAGGILPGAKDSEVVLIRRVSPELAEVKKVDLKRVLRDGKPQEDVELTPGDSIYVSKSMVGKLERFINVSKLGLYFPIPIP